METHFRKGVFLTACLAILLTAIGVLRASRISAIEPPTAVHPLPKGSAAEHGRKLFVQSCAHCHGDDARGDGEDGDGPDLSSLAISNARIAVVIRKGIPDEMPSFAKKHSAQDIAAITAYLRTLR